MWQKLLVACDAFTNFIEKSVTMTRRYQIHAGKRYPFGALADPCGVNFSIFSRHASSVTLLLYEQATCAEPFQVIPLDPQVNQTFFTWHVYVIGLPIGTYYTWQVDGHVGDPVLTGFHFSPQQELVDPWAKSITTRCWDRVKAHNPSGEYAAIRGVVVSNDYDWEGDTPFRLHSENSIIYELHVGGFTKHPSSQVQHPGTFLGFIEKIPYLKELGITHVELLPIMAFDEQDIPPNGLSQGLKNYWGYSTHSFFAPHPGYCVTDLAEHHRDEFRAMVKALHKAGIGVILDVVFNHTAEGDSQGVTINFKGMMNEIFYHLDANDRTQYLNFTGCGNTVNCNHPFVAKYLLECLEYWVRDMHVDGFRFDLASVLVRGEGGKPMYNAPLPWSIEFSDELLQTKLIAEAWDAGGLYQVGGFPGYRWAEWNGRYRDVIRRFIRGDPGLLGEVATRITGSSDLYHSSGRLPINSINFVTCHDGFTLYDLVSYNKKYNLANGENGQDGSDDNASWNHGVEGATTEQSILRLRHKQVKNFFAVLLLSQGIPMILAGDEVLRTQQGNNNAYCQDNEISWFNWDLVRENQSIFRFVKFMIALRKRHPSLMRRRFLTGKAPKGRHLPDIIWHGITLNQPQWSDPEGHLIHFTLMGVYPTEANLEVIMNISDYNAEVQIPMLEGKIWRLAVDTEHDSPHDIYLLEDQSPLLHSTYTVAGKSVVVLESQESVG